MADLTEGSKIGILKDNSQSTSVGCFNHGSKPKPCFQSVIPPGLEATANCRFRETALALLVPRELLLRVGLHHNGGMKR